MCYDESQMKYNMCSLTNSVLSLSNWSRVLVRHKFFLCVKKIISCSLALLLLLLLIIIIIITTIIVVVITIIIIVVVLVVVIILHAYVLI